MMLGQESNGSSETIKAPFVDVVADVVGSEVEDVDGRVGGIDDEVAEIGNFADSVGRRD